MGQKSRTPDRVDPRGLIRDAYEIDGITPGECRSIFLDWAIGVSQSDDMRAHITVLLSRHENDPDHPMTTVLRDGLGAPQRTGRRGGRTGRLKS